MNHISHRTSITVNAPIDETLPLFTAKGECLWIADWKPIYVYPASGEPMTGMIWKTLSHDENPTDDIWITTNYDTQQHTASYVKVTPNTLVTHVDIDCTAIDNTKTQVQITYTLTALSPLGQPHIKKLTKPHYDAWIQSWEKAVNHYLQHGERATAD